MSKVKTINMSQKVNKMSDNLVSNDQLSFCTSKNKSVKGIDDALGVVNGYDDKIPISQLSNDMIKMELRDKHWNITDNPDNFTSAEDILNAEIESKKRIREIEVICNAEKKEKLRRNRLAKKNRLSWLMKNDWKTFLEECCPNGPGGPPEGFYDDPEDCMSPDEYWIEDLDLNSDDEFVFKSI